MAKNYNGLFIGIGTAALASTLAAMYASSARKSKRRYAEVLRNPIPDESLQIKLSDQQLEEARIAALSRRAFEMALANAAATNASSISA